MAQKVAFFAPAQPSPGARRRAVTGQGHVGAQPARSAAPIQ